MKDETLHRLCCVVLYCTAWAYVGLAAGAIYWALTGGKQ
jgi:hypothetical protein